jgi:hypothetical protein
MAALTEWLQLMLAEIARKREDLEQARAEEARRASELPRADQPEGLGQTAAAPERARARNEPESRAARR